MSFLQPWAFGFAGLLPVIVLLYLLKVRRRTMPVSTLLFWEKVLQENRRRALFHRLRRWWSLLLHLLIFTLVLLALAGPTGGEKLREGTCLVLLLDTRARMQAVEPGGATRLALARQEAEKLVAQAGPAREIALLTAGPAPAVLVPFTGDVPALRAGLDAVRASEGGGELEPALHLARELLASRDGERKLLVLSDRAATPEMLSVGTPQDNIAITQFAARALPDETGGSEVLLHVANFGRAPVKGNVELSMGGHLLEVRPFALGPGEESAETLPLGEASGEITARLDSHDALPLDDSATAQLPARPPLRVLLVTGGNWFLEKLLGAETRVQYELLAPGAFRPALQQDFDVTIFDDFLPPGELAGNILYLGKTPFDSGAPPLREPLVTESDPDSPLLRSVHLEHVTFARSTPLRAPPTGGWSLAAPLRFGEEPLLLAGERGGQRVAAFGFRAADSDLPLRVSFPLLISNTLHWLARAPEETLPAMARPAAESDLRGASGGGGPSTASLFRAVPAVHWPLAKFLVATALALLALEWWLFHRRRTE